MFRGFRKQLLANRHMSKGEVDDVHSAEGVMLGGSDEVEAFPMPNQSTSEPAGHGRTRPVVARPFLKGR